MRISRRSDSPIVLVVPTVAVESDPAWIDEVTMRLVDGRGGAAPTGWCWTTTAGGFRPDSLDDGSKSALGRIEGLTSNEDALP